jgi:hypothetical protein
VSMRTWTAPTCRASSRAIVVLPVPGKPLRMMSIGAAFWHNLRAVAAIANAKHHRGRTDVTRRLSRSIVNAIDESPILRVRAGARSDHRFIGIWAVVVDGRVFARSWTQKPGGWYQTFLDDPFGTIQVGDRQRQVRVVRVRGTRIHNDIERACANKYTTPASLKYVRGFRAKRRRETTMEFVRP